MNRRPVRAFIFDVGGTLWFEARPVDPELIWPAEAAKVEPLLQRWGVRPARPAWELVRDIWREYEDGWRLSNSRGTYEDPYLPDLIRRVTAARGMRVSAEQAVEWWREAWIGAGHFNVELFPDTLDVLAELRAGGMQIAVNTNRPCTGEMFLGDASDFGFAQYIDVPVCSGDTGYVKPHPSTFELVLERLGCAPEEAAMVGDSCGADMAPAKRMGMWTVLKLNGRYDLPPCQDADFEVHDLTEILSLPIPGLERRPVAAESSTPSDDDNEDRY